MPHRRKRAATPPTLTAQVPPLSECCIALSGNFSGYNQAALLDIASALGAKAVKSLTKDATHLVTSQKDFDTPSTKVADAQQRSIAVVGIDWLLESQRDGIRQPESNYSFAAQSDDAEEDDAGDEDIGDSKPPAKGKGKRQASASPEPESEPESKKLKLDASGAPPALGRTQVAKSSMLRIPLDEGCYLTGHSVYVDGNGAIWDASLNQTNAGNNNNKFFRIQILAGPNNRCLTWTRWGRVGERGQSKVLGDGSLADAQKCFEKKFRDKSGLPWDDRMADPKKGKYVFVERSYESEDEDGGDDDQPKAGTKDKDEQPPEPTCTLDAPLQNLMKLIFNQQYFADTMSDMNYDANKMPLGKLSKAMIMRGYTTLKAISLRITNPVVPAGEQSLEELSNLFYSYIPHAFGRNRPPIIATQLMVKREIELLDNLADMKDAANIMKFNVDVSNDIHPLDHQYRGLHMEEMTPLAPDSSEHQLLEQYLVQTRGHTHSVNFKVEDIFRIERQGESARFGASPFAGPVRDRRLLWHGSRVTNFGGILSQGLRIAPPEAPVSGYMFGKGIYLADMSSKSANYCASHVSGGTALLLLCEAELGEPMQELLNADYDAGDKAKASGAWSTWGKGQTGPLRWEDASCVHPSLKGTLIPSVKYGPPGATNVAGAYLQYNEYICYDVAQVRLKYLFRVRMN
ncbi:hypothetical protein ANO11243_075880 [Dothideomycetidae sp. 11243]|nr:hypothetical protein ANO11243_075880 [fungal sp. No.11243]